MECAIGLNRRKLRIYYVVGGMKAKELEILLADRGCACGADVLLIGELERYAIDFPEARNETMQYLRRFSGSLIERRAAAAARKAIERIELAAMLEILAGEMEPE